MREQGYSSQTFSTTLISLKQIKRSSSFQSVKHIVPTIFIRFITHFLHFFDMLSSHFQAFLYIFYTNSTCLIKKGKSGVLKPGLHVYIFGYASDFIFTKGIGLGPVNSLNRHRLGLRPVEVQHYRDGR